MGRTFYHCAITILGFYLLGHSHTSHGSERHLEADGGEAAHHEHHGSSDGLDSAVGISLVLGFIFMLLIDQLANAKQQRSAVVSISGADIEVQSSGEIRTRCLFDDFLKAVSTSLLITFDCHCISLVIRSACSYLPCP